LAGKKSTQVVKGRRRKGEPENLVPIGPKNTSEPRAKMANIRGKVKTHNTTSQKGQKRL